jgi:hypothetical protein
MDHDKKAQQAVERTELKPRGPMRRLLPARMPKEGLTNKSKTPGAGILPNAGDDSVTLGSD